MKTHQEYLSAPIRLTFNENEDKIYPWLKIVGFYFAISLLLF